VRYLKDTGGELYLNQKDLAKFISSVEITGRGSQRSYYLVNYIVNAILEFDADKEKAK